MQKSDCAWKWSNSIIRTTPTKIWKNFLFQCFQKPNCPRLYIEVNVLLPDQAVKLPTATSSSLPHCSLRHLDVTDTEKLLFKNDCITAVIAILQKLLERSPIKYRQCRAPSSVSPFHMASLQNESIQGFSYLCDKLYEHGLFPSADARAKDRFENFLTHEVEAPKCDGVKKFWEKTKFSTPFKY